MKTFTRLFTMLAVAAFVAAGCVNEEPPYKEEPKPTPGDATGFLSVSGLSMRVVYDAVSRVDPGLLARAAFYWGNIAPDIAPTQAFRSHRAKFRLGMVNQKLARTMEAAGDDCGVWRRSYRLGVLCHYYADFCCYAHGLSLIHI